MTHIAGHSIITQTNHLITNQRLRSGYTPIDADQDGEEDRYTDAASVDKIRDHNDVHLDTDI